MASFECPVCHGRYTDPQPDGSRYFHACPPLSVAELAQLAADQVTTLYPELAPGFTRTELEIAVAGRFVARPGARNENIAPGAPPVIVKPGEVPDLEDAPRIAAERRLGDRITR